MTVNLEDLEAAALRMREILEYACARFAERATPTRLHILLRAAISYKDAYDAYVKARRQGNGR